MKKPAFDPTQPAEPVKPAFDPSQPFESVSGKPTEDSNDLLKAETFARSVAEGWTPFGVSEPAISSVTAVLGNLLASGADAEDLKDFFSKSIDVARIQKKYQSDVERRRELEKQFPGPAISGEVLGALVPSPAGYLAKGITAVAKGVSPAIKGAEKISKTAGAAIEGALQAGVQEAGKQAIQVPTGFITPEEQQSILGTAAFGAKLGGGIRGGIEAAKVAGGAGKTVLGAMLGPTQKTIESYLADPQSLERAKSPAQIKTLVDQTVSKIQDDIRSGELSVEKAKEVLAEAKTRFSETVQGKRADISDAFADARQKLQIAKEEALRPIKQAVVPQEIKQDVIETGAAIRKKVGEESQKSYLILDEMQAMVKRGEAPAANLGDIPARIKNIQDSLKIAGKVAQDEEAKAAFRMLNKYRSDYSHLWKENVAWPQVKQILQSIDRDLRTFGNQQNSAQFSEMKVRKLMELRSNLDELVKSTSDELGLGYREQMQRVSGLRDLQERLGTVMGREETLAGRLDGLWRPSKSADVQTLIEAGEQVGIDLKTPLQSFIRTKTMATNEGALRDIVSELPEAAAVRQLEQTRAMMRRPGGAEMLARQEARDVQQAQMRLQAARQSAEEAKRAMQELGPFSRVDSNINAIKTAVTEKNPQFQVYLENLSKASGRDFGQMIDDLRIAEGFSKEFTQGSRRVNLFGALGAGAYAIATGDPIAMAVAGGLGAAAGGMMDRFGGKVTQKVLDFAIKVRGWPTVQKINQGLADMPPEVRNYVLQDVVRSASMIRNETFRIDEREKQNIYDDIKFSDLDAVSKAQALEQMNKTGTVSGKTVQSIMLGKKPPKMPIVPEKKNTLEEDRPDVLRRMSEQ